MSKFWYRPFVTIIWLLLMTYGNIQAKEWTLQDCISYALANNITLQRSKLSKLSAHEDVLQSKAALLPSLNASTTHTVSYTPFPESGRAQVANGYVETSVDKIFYNGNYGINANWTVWNGGRNSKQVKLNKLSEQLAETDSAVTANSIQEQITQLYIQILYSSEAIKVSQQSLETSKKNEERGKTMVDVGSMSKADLSQLTAQRAQDEYNIVAAESNLRNYIRQLKQILEITDDDEFTVAIPETLENNAMQEIPALQTVYNHSLEIRPELESQRLSIKQQEINISMARAMGYPTVGITGGVSTNTTSMSDYAWGKQLKTNLTGAIGVTISVPILDQRQKRTAVNKARIAIEDSKLQLRNQQTQLYSTIENYWIQAVTNQAKYKSALANTYSQQASYEMLSEQFQLGLKNIVELMNGKTNLLAAQQSELESKYLTLLNIKMLKFYETGKLK
jgi:outer membrane protein